MDQRSLQRRYEAATALRWLGVGTVAPFVVLLMQQRGLSLGSIGMVVAVYGVTVAVLELPTGGLADSLGRRVVLATASATSVAATLVLFAGRTVAGFAAGWAMLGIGRALDSGALEAWYVDTGLHLDAAFDLSPGLARGEAVGAAALAAGSLLGGFVPRAIPGIASDNGHLTELSVPLLIGALIGMVHLAVVLLLIDEPPRDRSRSVGAAVREVPGVVKGAAALAARHPGIRMLLLATGVVGVTLTSLEVLWQPRFADLSSSTDTRLFGVVGAAIFAAAALGAMLVPRLVRRFPGAEGSIALAGHLGAGGCMLALAASGLVIPAAVAISLVYVFLGMRGPVHNALLHRRIPAETRSTMLSADSLFLQFGGFVSALLIPRLADVWGIPIVWGGVAIVLAATAALYPAVARSAELEPEPPQGSGDHIFVTGDRLRLRHPRPGDAETVAAMFSDPEVMRYLGGPRDPEEVAEEVRRDAAAEPNPTDLWPLELIDGGGVVGYCGLVPKEVDGVTEYEVIYVLARRAWGRGYATETAAAIIDYAFSERGLDRVISMIHPENEASVRVAQRVGMTFDRTTMRPSGKLLQVYLRRSGPQHG